MQKFVVLMCGLLITAPLIAAETPPECDWSGYTQVRYVDQLDSGADEWQMPQFRAKLVDTVGPNDKFVVQVELSLKQEKVAFHWVDVYEQHRFSPDLSMRVGLSSVPFGFDNPQSTPNLVGLDRPAATSRILPGKRDNGVFAMYSPPRYSKLFKEMETQDFGTADMGVAAVGYYMGEGRDNGFVSGTGPFVARGAYPFTFGGHQLGQAGLSFFDGKFATRDAAGDRVKITDRAFGVHAYLAPRPWGLAAEYVTGTMPGLDAGGETVAADYDGWYVLAMYRVSRKGLLYARTEQFDGFSKAVNGQPKAYGYQRQCYGYRHRIAPMTDLTVEFQDAERNGRDEDQLSAQVTVQY